MNKELPLVIAGIVFGFVALMHLLRLIYRWPIMLGGYNAPISVSIFGLIISIILAIWMFFAAVKK
ncbi:MAG TPA: hypothetical protein VGH95_05985 [Candidatus Aquirickettsiella sp.]